MWIGVEWHEISWFVTLTLLVGQQAGHPVANKNLCPLTLQCFDAVGLVRGRASCQTRFSTRYYQPANPVSVEYGC